jgi:putative acetyltransferase
MGLFCRIALSAAPTRRYLSRCPSTSPWNHRTSRRPSRCWPSSTATKLYPPEATYLLDVASLRAPDIRFFVARKDGAAVGCGALRVEEDGYGEIKRMFVAPAARGLGIAKRLLVAIEAEARRLGLHTLRLETGIYQTEALGLYAAVGYREIRPFGEYAADGPHSRFLAKPLAPAD